MVDNQTPPRTADDQPRRCAAPIEHLSFEIMSQIFLHCLPEESLPHARTDEAPALLGRICSLWRAIALSTPQLWAGRTLSGLGFPTPYYLKQAMAAAEWKIRAVSCLLLYQLWYTPDGVLDVILPHCSQWKHIGASLEPAAWNKIYSAISQGAPGLQSL
ncbi:hypothetical protein BD410DRAFT_635831 [Rickenella mellea]|uniref:F-box domain-containing protein n=1 Tax=Rickenella mellea TaxID=50990 RepID=A0A4Y7QCA6_9AGAM|nr:hypothetical protein BD410DRAFT_635831 [Rickenella mellea]